METTTTTTQTNRQYNDDCVINVKLTNNQWSAILDWLSHSPFAEAKETLVELNNQIKARAKETDTDFVGMLPIKTYNMLIFALGQAPYYVVAETIQQIFQQGQSEIQRLRDQFNAVSAHDQSDQTTAAVEKTTTSPDNPPKKRRASRKKSGGSTSTN